MIVEEYNKKVGIQYHTVLVKNPPSSKEDIKKMIISYYKNTIIGKPIKSDIYIYSISFYRKTDATSYFINNKEDPGGFSSNYIDDCEASEYYFIYTRDEKASNMWVANMVKEKFGIEYHDTIYCDYKKNPPLKSLPKIPYNK